MPPPNAPAVFNRLLSVASRGWGLSSSAPGLYRRQPYGQTVASAVDPPPGDGIMRRRGQQRQRKPMPRDSAPISTSSRRGGAGQRRGRKLKPSEVVDRVNSAVDFERRSRLKRTFKTGRPWADGSRAELEEPDISLDVWRAAVVQVDIKKIVPLKFSQDPTWEARALLGDTVLKQLMLEYIFANEPSRQVADKAYLTKRLSEALSNRNMALHAKKLLPPSSYQFLISVESSEHQLGTALEALAFEVRDNQLACLEVARALLKWSRTETSTMNWKGLMLQLGVPVNFEVLEQSGPSHSPTHTVRATLELESRLLVATSVMNKKSLAEQHASHQVLCKLMATASTSEEKNMVKIIRKRTVGGPDPTHPFFDPDSQTEAKERSPIEASANAELMVLQPLSYLSHAFESYVLSSLPEGMTVQEWFHSRERSKRFHAVMNAPYIFPEEIHSVRSWAGWIGNTFPGTEDQPTANLLASDSFDEDASETDNGDESEDNEHEYTVAIHIKPHEGAATMAYSCGRTITAAKAMASEVAYQQIVGILEASADSIKPTGSAETADTESVPEESTEASQLLSGQDSAPASQKE